MGAILLRVSNQVTHLTLTHRRIVLCALILSWYHSGDWLVVKW